MNSSIECSSWAKSFDPKPVTAVFWSYIFSCILTVLMLTPAVFLNFLVIFVITRTRSLCKPSNMLLCSLALADFGTGILAQPLYTTHIVTEIEGDVTLFCVTGAITAFVSYTLAGAGLFTLTAISVDRCLAIYRPMKYRACVTPKAVVQASVCMWIVAAFGASTRLLLNVKYFMFSLGGTMFVSLTTILVCSVLAFRSLKTQKEQIAGEMRLHQGKQMVQLASYRKYLKTMLILLGFVLLCYVPFVTVTMITAMNGMESNATRAAWNVADSIGYMNSTINPVVYCLRIPEIRRACQKALRDMGARRGGNVVVPAKSVTVSLRQRSHVLEAIPEEGSTANLEPPVC